MTPQARTEDILVQDVDGEVVLYDQTTDEAHLLNPTTALVWKHCDGETSVTALAALLAQELDVPADEALVEVALRELSDASLLSTPLETKNLTRRAALRKLAMTGAATAALVPAITSITAPTPAMASSSGGGGGGGGGGGTFGDPCDSDADCAPGFACKGGLTKFCVPC